MSTKKPSHVTFVENHCSKDNVGPIGKKKLTQTQFNNFSFPKNIQEDMQRVVGKVRLFIIDVWAKIEAFFITLFYGRFKDLRYKAAELSYNYKMIAYKKRKILQDISAFRFDSRSFQKTQMCNGNRIFPSFTIEMPLSKALGYFKLPHELEENAKTRDQKKQTSELEQTEIKGILKKSKKNGLLEDALPSTPPSTPIPTPRLSSTDDLNVLTEALKKHESIMLSGSEDFSSSNASEVLQGGEKLQASNSSLRLPSIEEEPQGSGSSARSR